LLQDCGAGSDNVTDLTTVASNRNRLLDAVRGVAILLILYYHLFRGMVAHQLPLLAIPLNLSWTGVDLFFVLSGYLLGGILMRNRNSDRYYRTFYGRRFLRILVPYWIAIAILFLTYQSPGSPWMYLTFTQNIVWAISGQWGPIFILPTWSLAVEEQFYLVLPLLIRLCPPKRLPHTLTVLILFAPVSRVLALHYLNPLAPYMLMPCRMDSLFLGVLIAWGTKNESAHFWLQRHVGLIWGAIALTGTFVVYALFEESSSSSPVMMNAGYSIVASFYGAVLSLLLIRKMILPQFLLPLAWFGLGAYSLYLFHMPLERYLGHIMGPHIVAPIAITVAAIGVAMICWRYIEAPLIGMGHRLFQY
jgi:peptidoglycan/LPS O-acetylase OafA/YrhL